MERIVKKLAITYKQKNSKMCLVCGVENRLGLQARFYGIETDELVAIFTAREEHQSYPGRMHGGIAATMLDETIGRAIMTPDKQFWGVTVDFAMKLRKAVPLGKELKVVARVESENRRGFTGTGEIILPDGSVAVEGSGKYLKLPIDKIADFDHEAEEEWFLIEEKDPENIWIR
ncbi:MAG: thioesterase [Desulfobulbus propionicus]|nr:MAG: thioesterase [Desulfobulbus propionicus]